MSGNDSGSPVRAFPHRCSAASSLGLAPPLSCTGACALTRTPPQCREQPEFCVLQQTSGSTLQAVLTQRLCNSSSCFSVPATEHRQPCVCLHPGTAVVQQPLVRSDSPASALYWRLPHAICRICKNASAR